MYKYQSTSCVTPAVAEAVWIHVDKANEILVQNRATSVNTLNVGLFFRAIVASFNIVRGIAGTLHPDSESSDKISICLSG